jgi:hypothetical protein
MCATCMSTVLGKFNSHTTFASHLHAQLCSTNLIDAIHVCHVHEHCARQIQLTHYVCISLAYAAVLHIAVWWHYDVPLCGHGSHSRTCAVPHVQQHHGASSVWRRFGPFTVRRVCFCVCILSHCGVHAVIVEVAVLPSLKCSSHWSLGLYPASAHSPSCCVVRPVLCPLLT